MRNFIRKLEDSNQILRIKKPVSAKYEAAAVMRKLDCGPAILFENIEGHDAKVIAGLCGTRDRLCQALGVKLPDLHDTLLGALQNPTSATVVSGAPVKDFINPNPDLREIPILTHFENDAGPYVTSSVVATRSQDGKIENVSIHRLLLLSKSNFAIRIVPRQLNRLWQLACELGKPLEVAISIGVEPAVLLAASMSVPFGVSEYWVANSLLDGKLNLVKCDRVDAYAPATAELVLESKIHVNKFAEEGPFADLLETYDAVRKQPVVEVVGLMSCRDYLYQEILPGGAEHRILMGLPYEIRILDAVRGVVPFVRGVHLTLGGGGWLHAIISIRKVSEGDVGNVIAAAFSSHPSLKVAVIVDEDVDPSNIQDVEKAVATCFQADKDLVIITGVRGSSLDPSSDRENLLTTKIGLDATRSLLRPKELFEKAKIPEKALEKADRIIEDLKKQGY